MVDINNFRDKTLLEKLIASEKSRFKDSDINNIVELDNLWRKTLHEVQELKTKLNILQKEFGKIMRDKSHCNVGKYKEEIITLKDNIKEKEIYVNECLVERNRLINLVGNIVHSSVPVSNDESDNEVVSVYGDKFSKNKYHHSEVMLKLGMYNPEAGSKVAGHRGYYLTGAGVQLNQALIRYGMDFLQGYCYEPIQTPFFMTKESMAKTAQLSEFDDLLYQVGDNKYLIATSEQPISCLHQDEWLQKKTIPLMYAGLSTCFRKEAGASGRDVKGLFRLHQFEKIEQFCIVSPGKSWEMLETMRGISEEFIKSLGLSYRVVNIVSGELNDAAAKKYDIEAWFPNTQEYRELVSCSNCTDYQSRKLLIRYGSKEKGKKATFAHMLNSTLCATERTMCCLAENYQCDEGMRIPDVLRKYIYGSPEFFLL